MDLISSFKKISTIESHTAGEPFRIILSGLPNIPKEITTIVGKREYARDNWDDLRKLLMLEPRGHADMYGGILVDPVSEGADIGILFTHNEGFSTMCGHGIIALTTALIQTEMFPFTTNVLKIDTPAGLVTAYPMTSNRRVTSVRFHNVPSFSVLLSKVVNIPQIGEIIVDVAFGGAFYAYVNCDQLQLSCEPSFLPEMILKAKIIKKYMGEFFPVHHPFDKELSFYYGVIFIGVAKDPTHHSRNVCIFADGEVDRSPTGTGVSARLAIHYAKKEIQVGQKIIIESILGTTFSGQVVSETNYGKYNAIIPQVEGCAYITGKSEFYVDPDDPLSKGFLLRG